MQATVLSPRGAPVPVSVPWLVTGPGEGSRRDAGVPSGQSAAGAIERSQVTLLVVDDTPSARYALARGLRKLGFQVLEASNGQQALKLATQCSAVFLDVRLPDIAGTDVCRMLRSAPSTCRLPVVHVSSLRPAEHGPDIGDFECADAYLISPVDVVFAANLVEDLLRRGRDAS